MRIVFLLAILLFVQSFAAKQTIAVLPAEGVLDDNKLDLITDKMHEIALNVFSPDDFILLTQDAFIKRLGGPDNYVKECKESTCVVDLGRKANVDYIAQTQILYLDDNLRIKIDLYKVSNGAAFGKFTDYSTKDIYELLSIIEKNVPDVFRKIPSTPTIVPLPIQLATEDTTSPAKDVEKEKEKKNEIKIDTTYLTSVVKSSYIDLSDYKVEKEESQSYAIWGIIASGVVGTYFILKGISKDNVLDDKYDQYKSLGSGYSSSTYEEAWEDVKNARTARNIYYILGISSFVFGIYLCF